MSNFNDAVTQAHLKRIDARHNADEGQAQKNIGRARAGAKKSGLIATAQRIARELGQFGAVSINEVTRKLQEQGYESTANVDPKHRKLWKGGVFATADWVCVGEIPSTFVAMHARPVKQWALKSWLQKNAINGTNLRASAFDVARLYAEFKREYPGIPADHCRWTIGLVRLSPDILMLIKAEKGKLYGIPVLLVGNSMGAMINITVAQ